MKIAFVVHDYNRSGGHSRYVAELAERFDREHEVHVFANGIERNGESGVHFHHVRAVRLSALTCVLTFPLFARGLPLESFDIVHAQGWCGTSHNVLTAHICNEAWFEARRAFADRISPKERLFASLVNPLERSLFRDAKDSWVIAISDRVRDDLATYYGRRDKVAVIHHGVDVERFNPTTGARARDAVRREFGFAETDLVALFVGDLRKGVDTAARALDGVDGWKLLVVSWTPPQAYKSAIERAGLGDRVVFAPPSREIERFYGAADAFVFPTPYDAFGMVITEAMASGLPVIASRQAGASELIDHERNGLLLDDPSSADEIATWLRRLRDAGLRDALGRAARERVEALTWDRIAAETMQVYERVLEEKRR